MGLRKKQRMPALPVELKGKRWNPFDAVPVVADGVEVRTDSQCLIQLRKELTQKPGVASFLARKLGFKRDIRINLDERGTFFWQLINSKRSLSDIEKHFRIQYSLTDDDSKKAVLIFIKMLMLRHVINLKIPGVYPESKNRKQTDVR